MPVIISLDLSITAIILLIATIYKTINDLVEYVAQGGGKFRQVADEKCDTWLTNRAPL